MNHQPHDHMTDADEREWLAQERALRDERDGAATSDDPSLAAYRMVAGALRAPLPEALPADFARRVAARRRGATVRADTWLEQQFQRALLAALAVAALAACANYGDDWLRASAAALPLLDKATTLNWSAALAACLGLSWAVDVIGHRAPAR